MIKSITVTNHLDEVIELELRAPEKSGFAVRSIEGLGPVKATINMTDMSSNDGSIYNSAQVGFRNILLNLKFLWAPTIEEVRHKSYRYFPIKKQVCLSISTDKRTTEISGYVESNIPNIFSDNEGCLISIICPDPYFHSKGYNKTVFSGSEAVFEFPFSNESFTEKLLETSLLKADTAKNIIYNGEVNTGIILSIFALGPATNILITNSGTQEVMTINTAKFETIVGSPLKNKDTIIISTIKGSKFINLIRDGETINIMNCIDKNSDWFSLVPGDNVFAYRADTGESNLLFSIENRTVYEGV